VASVEIHADSRGEMLPDPRMDAVRILIIIGHIQRIFSPLRLLLVTSREYSHHFVFYWSHPENILTTSSSIGHIQRIFSPSRLLLVTSREYSHHLVFYWSHPENILTISSSIGRMDAVRILTIIGHIQRIFSPLCLLLVTSREYSHHLVFYWSHGRGADFG
jgi:hypothetical protein